ncbi:MAG: hypothetical protein KatS3mg124_1131 [Porticoccaceae bacterium]|nr:MAG: hypothetical protein KatS3mg124_1131 [Porticoccaceae bacterium]
MTETITTRLWHEEAEEDNPFVARRCRLAGYDVYGALLPRVGWAEFLYLLFREELPEPAAARLLEAVAVALAHPGIRDPSVRAAMNAAVGRSHRAAALMAALAVGAGRLGGAAEVARAVALFGELGRDLDAWRDRARRLDEGEDESDWEHLPGFDPRTERASTPVCQALETFAKLRPGGWLGWLWAARLDLEAVAGCGLALSGVVAAAFADLGFPPEAAEMLYLFLRLPGAAAQALEQERLGWRRYPFFAEALEHLPAADYRALLQRLGERL